MFVLELWDEGQTRSVQVSSVLLVEGFKVAPQDLFPIALKYAISRYYMIIAYVTVPVLYCLR